MPNGGLLRHHNIRDQCLLDCVAVVGRSRRVASGKQPEGSGIGEAIQNHASDSFSTRREFANVERNNSYYILDVLEWCGAEMTACECEMRAFWMNAKYAEYGNFIDTPPPMTTTTSSDIQLNPNLSQLIGNEERGMEMVRSINSEHFQSERMQQLQSAIAHFSADSPNGLWPENAQLNNNMTNENSMNMEPYSGAMCNNFIDGMEVIEMKKKKPKRKKKNKKPQSSAGEGIELDESTVVNSKEASMKPRNIVLLQKFAGAEEYQSLATVKFPWNFSVQNSVAYLYHREAHYYDNEEFVADRFPHFLVLPLQSLFSSLGISRGSSGA
jgi:hypothetical protein